MKNLPPGSVVFYFSRSEKVSFLIRGLFFTMAGICFLFAVLANSTDAFGIFYIGISAGFFCAGIYFLKKRWQKTHCILTPQYVQIGGRRFTIHELECARFNAGPWDGAFIITRAAYKQLPFFHKILHRYAFLLIAVLLTAAIGIYAILFHEIPLKICIRTLVAAAFCAWLGFFQYKNGRIYGFLSGKQEPEILKKELSSFCQTHQITLYYD